ncbi:MAG: Cyclic nucleotide-binding domain protein [Deltaproteobacteria bacterium]|jgi:CRP-like cAMP-binding protein|nr:Cyclic nucleotide-binding domain protein [Deltaproteobacteria bacterium]
MREEKLLFKKFGMIFPAGTILFEEGQPCTGMYIIQKGRVRLYKKAGRKKVTIDVLEDGDFFGEMACLLGQPRSINAVVEEESQILVVESDVLDELFREKNGLGIKVLGNLASRLRKAYEIIGRLVEEQGQPSEKEFLSP